MRFYSVKSREEEPTALPDAEVFYIGKNKMQDEEGAYLESGYYYWYCLPGCLPDSCPIGPFKTIQDTINACREEYEE